MTEHPRFYAVIIGTEILNGRRNDRHFAYLRDALLQRGFSLYAAHIIKDDPELIRTIFSLVQRDSQGVMFSFGGIGATPDDLTRQIAADVFTNGPLVRHKGFERDIIERFGDDAYPHRVHMADLPADAKLLKNPVNNMSGFHLDSRYFFVPGFPEMAHPMIDEALECFYPANHVHYRKTLLAQTSENTLIAIMEKLPAHIEFSSLPILRDGQASVEISVASFDEAETQLWFGEFETFLHEHAIPYRLLV